MLPIEKSLFKTKTVIIQDITHNHHHWLSMAYGNSPFLPISNFHFHLMVSWYKYPLLSVVGILEEVFFPSIIHSITLHKKLLCVSAWFVLLYFELSIKFFSSPVILNTFPFVLCFLQLISCIPFQQHSSNPNNLFFSAFFFAHVSLP